MGGAKLWLDTWTNANEFIFTKTIYSNQSVFATLFPFMNCVDCGMNLLHFDIQLFSFKKGRTFLSPLKDYRQSWKSWFQAVTLQARTLVPPSDKKKTKKTIRCFLKNVITKNVNKCNWSIVTLFRHKGSNYGFCRNISGLSFVTDIRFVLISKRKDSFWFMNHWTKLHSKG